MKKSMEYIENLKEIINRIEATQADKIEEAAQLIATAITDGYRLHAFGTGHSHMMAEEVFYRAGGLVNVNPILEESLMLHGSASSSSHYERLPDFGRLIFEHNDIKSGDVVIVASNSGRNSVCIDFVLCAKSHGVKVIALTNMEHSTGVTSRHPCGKRLFELADVILDNCGCFGDASIVIDGISTRVAPTSTVTGALILNAIEARVAEIIVENGSKPEIFASFNTDNGEIENAAYLEKYKNEIRSL